MIDDDVRSDDRSRLMVEVKRAVARTLKAPVGGAPGGYQTAVAKSFPVTTYQPGDVPPSFNGVSGVARADLGDLPLDQVVLVENVRRATAGGRAALHRVDALSLSEDARLRRDRIRTVLDDLDRVVAREDGPLVDVVEPLLADLDLAVHGNPPETKPFEELLVGTGEPPTPAEREQIDLVIELLVVAKRTIRAAWEAYRNTAGGSPAAYDRARLALAALVVENASDARQRFADLGVGAAESEAHWLPGGTDITVDGFLDAVEELGTSVPALLATLGHEAVPGIRGRAARLQPLAERAAGHADVRDAGLRDALTDLSRALAELAKPQPAPVIGPVTLVPWPDDRAATAVENIRDGGLTVKTGPGPFPVEVRNPGNQPPPPPPPDPKASATSSSKATKTKESKVR